MNQYTFNERLRQVVIFVIIVFIFIVLVTQVKDFIPGILGAITLYIISRKKYFQTVYSRKWKKGYTAGLFILGFVLLIAVPVYFSVLMVSPRISELMDQKDTIVQSAKTAIEKLNTMMPVKIFSVEKLNAILNNLSQKLPGLVNSTLSIFINLFVMFFILYYMLVHGSNLERALARLIPLQKDSINALAKETRSMVRANAIGIPVISIVQGIVAAIGYWIFGIDDPILWGFLTGLFAFFPIVGTMIIWVPLVLMLFSKGDSSMAIGLAVYSLLITGNVDYVARMSLMKRMGDVHPLITVFGVIVGLRLFGFVGLIFGPLLISYFIILVKIYSEEFSASNKDKMLALETASTEGSDESQITEEDDTNQSSGLWNKLKNLLGGR